MQQITRQQRSKTHICLKTDACFRGNKRAGQDSKLLNFYRDQKYIQIMKNPMQSKLTKIAQLIGIGASVRVPEIGMEHEVVA